ncbi:MULTISPECIES: hypothetical protein [Stenotrophomonas]|uniref:hypothetical protein n=1 Tax=Stenotrophomonas TaxID=40323 RepID=UPI00155FDEC5|nr:MULTISPECIES: hypothetical protein [Stenotrophomonas]
MKHIDSSTSATHPRLSLPATAPPAPAMTFPFAFPDAHWRHYRNNPAQAVRESGPGLKLSARPVLQACKQPKQTTPAVPGLSVHALD